MPANISYNRPKSSLVNSTGIQFSVKASELDNVPANLPGAAQGNSGELNVLYTADADESGGADVQNIAIFKFTPAIDPKTGMLRLNAEFTPVNGNGSLGAVQSNSGKHPQDMDAWQSAAGRARQA